jgi:hypothetical protein
MALLALAGVAEAVPIRAGVGMADITPPAGVELHGFGKHRTSKAVHDPLMASVAVIRTPTSSMVWVASDLHRLQSPRLVDRIRRGLQVQHVVLGATHNHSAPALEPSTADSSWARQMEDKIYTAVSRANENLFSAEISFARGNVIAAHNYRIVENGRTRERWSNPAEEGTAPIDPVVTVIRIDEQGGALRGLLVHYSGEPAVLGPESTDISGEFPSRVRQEIGKNLPGVVCLFVAGAGADVYPFEARLSGAGAYEQMERMGSRIAKEAVRVVRSGTRTAVEPEVSIQTEQFEFAGRWDKRQRYELGLTTVMFGKQIAAICVPGEMFVNFQIAAAARSPLQNTLVIGSSYSAGSSWAGTVPTIGSAADGGYGASYATEIALGAGEALVDAGLIRLHYLLGQLDVHPRGRLQFEIPDIEKP